MTAAIEVISEPGKESHFIYLISNGKSSKPEYDSSKSNNNRALYSSKAIAHLFRRMKRERKYHMALMVLSALSENNKFNNEMASPFWIWYRESQPVSARCWFDDDGEEVKNIAVIMKPSDHSVVSMTYGNEATFRARIMCQAEIVAGNVVSNK